jgi:hypothetical protein
VSSLVAGGVFGVGLAVAQMTDPRKVLAFLDVTGAWDPSLLLVLGSAVVLSAAAYRRVLTKPTPRLDERFHLPKSVVIDSRLISGAATFGIGWGLAGYCPGPVIASLGFGNPEALWVVPSLLVGAAFHHWLDGEDWPATRDQALSLDVFDIKN